ncbi:MAG TPA: glutamate synthase-related protein [Rhodanobacteraceae bacterium]|nr:glutamate synthase-related protein [Rhodanobacteraceae bacterium]
MEGMGLPLRESLPLLVDTMIEQGLRGRIRVICADKCITAYEVAWALATGADFVNLARGFMFALGCIQAMRCNRRARSAQPASRTLPRGDGRWVVVFAGRPAHVSAGASGVIASSRARLM